MNFLLMVLGSLFFLIHLVLVTAHGFVSDGTLEGKTFKGPGPFSGENAESPVRKIPTTFPITSVSSADMNCGINAKPAAIVASAKAGSKVTFAWSSATKKNWGHSIGPILTYLAACEGSCADFDSKNAKFFKISQTGRKKDSMTWVQANIKAGKTYTTTIPAGLPNGQYIIQHELVAMHFATKHGGAQIYPSCIQVNVTGSQAKSLPSDAALVSFPGAYKATDPGIFTPKIFTQRDYVFPGPPVVDFGGSKEQALTDGAGLDDAEDDCQEPLIAEAPGHAKRSRIMRDVHR